VDSWLFLWGKPSHRYCSGKKRKKKIFNGKYDAFPVALLCSHAVKGRQERSIPIDTNMLNDVILQFQLKFPAISHTPGSYSLKYESSS